MGDLIISPIDVIAGRHPPFCHSCALTRPPGPFYFRPPPRSSRILLFCQCRSDLLSHPKHLLTRNIQTGLSRLPSSGSISIASKLDSVRHRTTFSSGKHVILRASGLAGTGRAPGLLGATCSPIAVRYGWQHTDSECVYRCSQYLRQFFLIGSSSVSQRDEIPAFSSQFDGTNSRPLPYFALSGATTVQ